MKSGVSGLKASLQLAGRFAACASCLLWFGLFIGAGSTRVAAAERTNQPGKPNIVLILADDLGAECLGSYGSASYKTPHLDELARTGLRFENCYAEPLCSPSRVQLMTGRYGFRTGWTNLIGRSTPEFFNPKEKTFGHMMKSAGYATALAGKWQLADFHRHPNNVQECGFDEYSCWAWIYDGQRTPRYWDPFIWQNGQKRDDVSDKYGEDVFCDFLIDFITRHQPKPFFIYYPMALVHAPFEPTPGSRNSNDRTNRAENFPDMVAYMDKTVGRLVATLDKLQLREKTLILFSGDNGTPREITSQARGLKIKGGKGTVTHFGTHVPLIANWKGTVAPGRVNSNLIDFSDVLPTIAELTGAEPARGVMLDGRSFAPQLRGQRGSPREWVFVQLGPDRFIRDSRWLLHSDGRLYDMETDWFEKQAIEVGENGAAKAAKTRLQAALDGLK